MFLDSCFAVKIRLPKLQNQHQEYEDIYLAKLTVQMISHCSRLLSTQSGTTAILKRTHEDFRNTYTN